VGSLDYYTPISRGSAFIGCTGRAGGTTLYKRCYPFFVPYLFVQAIDCSQRQQPPRLLGIFRFSRQVAQLLSSEILAKSNRPAHGPLRISPIHSESQQRFGGNPHRVSFSAGWYYYR
jgi:hypothetical protein